MGKYDSYFTSSYSQSQNDAAFNKANILVKIANELAESNRLKRIELESKFVEQEIKTTPEALTAFTKSLEDQT